jgi:RimJ/RimL family protein N-acetyltransferase
MSFVHKESVDTFATVRFSLRPLDSGDEALYQALYCDSDTMRFIGTPLSTEQATRSFRAALKQTIEPYAKSRFFAVSLRGSMPQIGICGVSFGVPRLDTAEVGMALVTSVRGRGYSHEILGAFIDHVLGASEVEEVWVRYVATQKEVVRLNRGLGFVVSGVQPYEDDSRQMAYVRRNEWKAVTSTNRGQDHVKCD